MYIKAQGALMYIIYMCFESTSIKLFQCTKQLGMVCDLSEEAISYLLAIDQNRVAFNQYKEPTFFVDSSECVDVSTWPISFLCS